MSRSVRTICYHGDGGRILVMLRLRMSSSLTTLFMSFSLSSSTMSIFHCSEFVSEVWEQRKVFVRRRGSFV
jgi:hypothetical protein